MLNFRKMLATTMAFAMVGCATKTKPEVSMSELKDGTYQAMANGHNGPLELSVKIENGKIATVECVSNVETKGIGTLAIDKITNMAVNNQTTNIDFATGATISSAATISALKDALKQAGATEEMLKAGEQVSINMILDQSEYTYDVVIVGAGGAGLSAAVEAADNGAKVVVLEKTSQIGGNTVVSGGGINIPGSDLQKNKGIEDSIEIYKEDTLKGGDRLGDVELVNTLANNALPAYEWLKDKIQMEFIVDRVQQFGGHSVPRACIPVGNSGYEMMSKLEKVAMDKGVDIFKNTKAEELVKDDKGAIVGVVAENNGKKINLKADKAVILASGGFGANIEMREKYNPEYGKQYKTTCISATLGDGITLAEAVGADFIDMSQIQVYPTCNPITGIISYVANARFDGAVLVNQAGSRFVDDMNRRDVVSNGILSQDGGYAYLLWGQEIEGNGNMTKMHEKEFMNLKNSGLLFVGDTLEDVAKQAKIDATKLQETITKYNEMVADGEDKELHRGGKLRPIAEGPFYLQKVAPATHHTMGGVKINSDAQVMDVNGGVIDHLFAAGEVTGGIHGANRLGGNAITDIVVFGRIAGKNAAK